MTLSRPARGLMILEHTPRHGPLAVLALCALCLACRFRQGPTDAVVASGLVAAWLALRGAQQFEHLRLVFDARAARVGTHRRTGKPGATATACARGDIGSVAAQVTGPSQDPNVQRALVNPVGRHAGQRPLTLVPIARTEGPDLVLAVNSWLKHTR